MSQGSAAAKAFLDREAAAAVVTCYATALDARDWRAYRALFTDEIAIDYGAIGSLVATVTADEWTNPCRTLRSVEHTSDIPSTMRPSYAVFCMKKNNNTHII